MTKRAQVPSVDEVPIAQLWDLVTGRSFIDSQVLRLTVDRLHGLDLDPRTQELAAAVELALAGKTTAGTKFPSLAPRLGKTMKKATIEECLEDLGAELSEPVKIIIGGSSSLILAGLLERSTESIDMVDEVPASICALHQWRDVSLQRYGLDLAHFQSHYLPREWECRLVSWGTFRRLEVHLVDPLDILVGKLFSRRLKDKVDLDTVLPSLTRVQFDRRLLYADRLAADPGLLEQADKTYYVLFGEQLPSF